jgi:hypothetical protein
MLYLKCCDYCVFGCKVVCARAGRVCAGISIMGSLQCAFHSKQNPPPISCPLKLCVLHVRGSTVPHDPQFTIRISPRMWYYGQTVPCSPESCSLPCNTPCHASCQVLAACTHLLVSAVRSKGPSASKRDRCSSSFGRPCPGVSPSTAPKATCVKADHGPLRSISRLGV